MGLTHQESKDVTVKMLALYKEGKSFQDLALMFGVTRQRVHQRLKSLIGPINKMRDKNNVRHVMFDGMCFFDDGRNGYFYHISGNKRLALHREVWKSVHGPIQKGFHIHHKDGDKNNNGIDNLEMLSISEHMKRHAKYDPEIFRKMGQSKSALKLETLAKARLKRKCYRQ